MCTSSPTGIPILPSSSAVPAPIGGVHSPTVHVSQVKKDPSKFLLIDVREKDEVEGHLPNTLHIPMGQLLSDAADNKLDPSWKDKELILYCNAGYRSGIAARELTALGLKAKTLAGGVDAWKDPAFADYDVTVVISYDWSNEERASLGAVMALNAQKGGAATALCFMADGVHLMKKDALKQKPFTVPNPMPKIDGVITQFLQAGGTVFLCRTCLATRNLKAEDMEPFSHMFSSPDLVRFSVRGKLMQF
eukprot:TRINITY_DN2427_c0_g1_i1.p1 TRINITY_DN2427_c0_g1~~TRINITY_DN2427_c0_g1_i1.p1  ORF type:complete len:248 (+),score=69.28 TRINITY_DN2427_c0_g1_i1:62-805(+)